MKKLKKITNVSFALIILALAGFTPKQKSGERVSGSITMVRYTADLTSVFPNPERGWHNRRDVDGRGNNDVRDFSDVKAAGHTLVHSYLRLDDFKILIRSRSPTLMICRMLWMLFVFMD